MKRMEKKRISIGIAKPGQAEEIHEVMERVYRALEDKNLFVCDSPEFVREHIEKKGFIVIASDETGKIVGSLIVRFPGMKEDNLGRDIGLGQQKLCKVAHMESVVVLPSFRGHSLQSRMLAYAENKLDTGRYGYLMATVSPDNKASCHSFEKNQYKVVMTKKKYGGRWRRIYFKNLFGDLVASFPESKEFSGGSGCDLPEN